MEETVDDVEHDLVGGCRTIALSRFTSHFTADIDLSDKRRVARGEAAVAAHVEGEHVGRAVVPEELTVQPLDLPPVRQNHVHDGRFAHCRDCGCLVQARQVGRRFRRPEQGLPVLDAQLCRPF